MINEEEYTDTVLLQGYCVKNSSFYDRRKVYLNI